MNEKEIIEKMAELLKNTYHSTPWYYRSWYKIAEIVYKKLLPEGSVVLTEMQYNALLSKQSTIINIDEQLKKEFEYELKQTRKETAKKLAEKLKESLDISVIGYSTSEVIRNVEDTIDNVAKQFGVEVEE